MRLSESGVECQIDWILTEKQVSRHFMVTGKLSKLQSRQIIGDLVSTRRLNCCVETIRKLQIETIQQWQRNVVARVRLRKSLSVVF